LSLFKITRDFFILSDLSYIITTKRVQCTYHVTMRYVHKTIVEWKTVLQVSVCGSARACASCVRRADVGVCMCGYTGAEMCFRACSLTNLA
jgi:hypothetical protein